MTYKEMINQMIAEFHSKADNGGAVMIYIGAEYIDSQTAIDRVEEVTVDKDRMKVTDGESTITIDLAAIADMTIDKEVGNIYYMTMRNGATVEAWM